MLSQQEISDRFEIQDLCYRYAELIDRKEFDALRDEVFEENHTAGTAQFGFFESVNDDQVSAELFQAVFEWAKVRGMERVHGPLNPCMNEECGLLVPVGLKRNSSVSNRGVDDKAQRMRSRAFLPVSCRFG